MRRSSKRRKDTLVQLTKGPPLGTTSWRAAESLLKLRFQVNSAWPNRWTDSDGIIGDELHQLATSDHNPWVKDGSVGIVTAIDITHDPVSGCDANGIVEALAATTDPRIEYIIWNRHIIKAKSSLWVWRPYDGLSPHTEHFHLSVVSTKSLYDSDEDWGIMSLA